MKIEGKFISVQGVTLEVFPISVLVDKLNKITNQERTPQTIRKWELKGVIPKCSFRYKSRRYFHMKQIEAICKIAKEEDIRQGRDFADTNFVARVWEELPKLTKSLVGEKERAS